MILVKLTTVIIKNQNYFKKNSADFVTALSYTLSSNVTIIN